MATPPQCDLTGVRAIYRGDTWGPHRCKIGRRVDDAVLVATDATVTSADADFTAGDVGASIKSYTVSDDGVWTLSTAIPAGTTVLSRTNESTIEMSANAAASSTNTAIVIGAKDITGYTFLAQIRRGWNSADPLGTIDVATITAASGIVDLSITAANSALLEAGDAIWDLQSTAGTAKETHARGNVEILPDSSRP